MPKQIAGNIYWIENGKKTNRLVDVAEAFNDPAQARDQVLFAEASGDREQIRLVRLAYRQFQGMRYQRQQDEQSERGQSSRFHGAEGLRERSEETRRRGAEHKFGNGCSRRRAPARGQVCDQENQSPDDGAEQRRLPIPPANEQLAWTCKQCAQDSRYGHTR